MLGTDMGEFVSTDAVECSNGAESMMDYGVTVSGNSGGYESIELKISIAPFFLFSLSPLSSYFFLFIFLFFLSLLIPSYFLFLISYFFLT